MTSQNNSTPPSGYQTVIPYINCADATGLITFLEKVLGGKLAERILQPDGKIMHAEVRLGNCVVMLSDACQEMKPEPSRLYLYLDEVDSVYLKALENGCSSIMEPGDMFWGDRMGCIRDTWGNTWFIAKYVEDVPANELQSRADAFMQQHGDQ